MFSIKSIANRKDILIKLTLVISIILLFISLFSYLNISLTDHEFYVKYPLETILLLLGTVIMILGNFLIFLMRKSGFWLSLLGALIVFSINISFEQINFFKSFYGIEFQILIFLMMKYKFNGKSLWNEIYNN